MKKKMIESLDYTDSLVYSSYLSCLLLLLFYLDSQQSMEFTVNHTHLLF